MKGMMYLDEKPYAYICSPYRGNVEANTENARSYCRQAYDDGYVPLAPHLYFPQFLNDSNPEERAAGLVMALELLLLCDVLIVFDDEITDGMAQEIELAKDLGIPILEQ